MLNILTNELEGSVSDRGGLNSSQTLAEVRERAAWIVGLRSRAKEIRAYLQEQEQGLVGVRVSRPELVAMYQIQLERGRHNLSECERALQEALAEQMRWMRFFLMDEGERLKGLGHGEGGEEDFRFEAARLQVSGLLLEEMIMRLCILNCLKARK